MQACNLQRRLKGLSTFVLLEKEKQPAPSTANLLGFFGLYLFQLEFCAFQVKVVNNVWP